MARHFNGENYCSVAVQKALGVPGEPQPIPDTLAELMTVA